MYNIFSRNRIGDNIDRRNEKNPSVGDVCSANKNARRPDDRIKILNALAEMGVASKILLSGVAVLSHH